jgi:predicted transglutaminase-like cysteine proteinase
MLQQGAGADDEAQLAAVNAFFNRRIVFRDDAQVWGQLDYWASPLETLDKGEGDCEDYVVAKHFSLLALGMPVQRLRLVYVRAQAGGESVAHMVLAYYGQPGAEPMILDTDRRSLCRAVEGGAGTGTARGRGHVARGARRRGCATSMSC